jgi:hypothetical protein
MSGSVSGSSSSEDALTRERAAWNNVQERATVPRHCPAFDSQTLAKLRLQPLQMSPYESPRHRSIATGQPESSPVIARALQGQVHRDGGCFTAIKGAT